MLERARPQRLSVSVTSSDTYIACEQALLFGRVKRVSRERASGEAARGRGLLAPRSRVLARLASLAQVGELARRLIQTLITGTFIVYNFYVTRFYVIA